MKQFSKLTTAIAAVTLAVLTAMPATASAGPICTPGDPLYNPSMCELMQNSTAPAATTTAPSTSTGGSSGGVGAWVSEHAGLIVLVVAGLIAWAVIAGMRQEKEEEKKEAANRAAGALARGRRIASDHHVKQVAAARAAAPAPDPSVYDPMGLGLAPPPMPEPKLPDPPAATDADLRRYARFGAVFPWEPGTAIATVIAQDGTDRIEAAWMAACQQVGAGDVDPESGEFTPIARHTNIRPLTDDSGDVDIVMQPAGLHVAEAQLNRVLPTFAVTARVESASPFVREAATGRYVTRLTNRVASPAPAAQSTAAEQEQPRVDPRWS